MKKHCSIFTTTAFVALSALYSFSAAAQAPASDLEPAETSPSAAVTVDETKLDQFADAYVKIQTLRKDAEKQPPSSDPAKAQQQQTELQGKMTEAVQASGLDVVDFNSIAQAMVADTDLRARIQAKVQARANQGG